ncbi:pyrimidine operon attenuation protein / uracil phosphoribosyltransferase [Filimonas lacunae]|uniref:Pyrimidine operon attenuation protein / uracil phosphoribosyltransferase n=1 Tax=Filimonas lacunae TaxID=477680 RepID=A0A173MJ73_9BACT|nr:phosphoribosyltransferase family protein [Filimonas lacunae]BAV07529.1 uracil phosphoribosyltransferase [Filimonas lacunae]SIT30064.1 pyrimidine operon attenuation protein / uracil phosphoribosyltransferase [Filimonas lacunae]
MSNRNYFLNQASAEQKMQRMALEIAEHLSEDEAPLVLIGVRQSGMVLAEKMGVLVKAYLKAPVQVISVTLDKHHPEEVTLSESVDFNGKNVIVLDDVTNSGRTLLYALKPLLAFFPKRIQTLVLVERMHKHFPIKADFVGLSIATTEQDHIQVEVENGEIVGAYL